MSVPQIGEAGYPRVEHDVYETPAWVTKVLMRWMPVNGQVWEPAAGNGHMVAELRAHGLSVYASDIRVLPGLDRAPCDFAGGLDWVYALDHKEIPFPKWIITNAPFGRADDFIRRALAVTKESQGGVAMLFLYEFDAPVERRIWFQHPAFHCKIVLPKRIRWIGLEEKRNPKTGRISSPRQVHAWYVWRWDRAGQGNRIIYS
jgi:hypothetical protein